MRKWPLCLSVLFLTSCSWFNRDLWSAYDALPLEVETLENTGNQWIYDYFPLIDGSYLMSRRTEETYYTERCNGENDSILFSFPLSSYRLQGAILANDSVYMLAADYETYPHVDNPYKLMKLDYVTMEVEKEIFFNIENQNGISISLIYEEEYVVLVCRGDTTFIMEFTYNLDWVATYDFEVTENQERGHALQPLSTDSKNFDTPHGLYFIFEQSLFHKVGQTVTQLPYAYVSSILGYENQQLTFLQYDYSTHNDAEHFYVGRITLNQDDQELSSERLLSIENPYLEGSHNKNNSSLMGFTLFEGDLYIIGYRSVGTYFSRLLDFGVLRLDLDTLDVATYFKSGENATTDFLLYYNGHFAYYSEFGETEERTLRQINFRVSST